MNGEGAPKGAPDDLQRRLPHASEAAPIVAEYRGGPLATIRLLADAYLRPDPAWQTIQASRPDDEVRPSPDAAPADTAGEGEA